MGLSSGNVFRDSLRSLYFILFVAGQWHDWNMDLALLGPRENCGSKWRDAQAEKDTEQPEANSRG